MAGSAGDDGADDVPRPGAGGTTLGAAARSPAAPAARAGELEAAAGDRDRAGDVGPGHARGTASGPSDAAEGNWWVVVVCVFTTIGGVVFGFDTGVIGAVIGES